MLRKKQDFCNGDANVDGYEIKSYSFVTAIVDPETSN